MVHTASGPVVGETGPHGHRFLGIPFAAPPIGRLRFRAPAPVTPWSSPRRCDSFGPAAPQGEDRIRERLFGQPPLVTDEANCLTLNIFSPEPDDRRRPVLFWIHGGGFVTGAGVDPMFDGSRLAYRHDIVVVTVNYRLGALGFLYLEDLLGPDYAGSGAAGILDQVAALGWVRDNIAGFGGDPDNITIAGQSAGAMSVAVLMAMPSASRLFHRAVIQSGSGELVRTPASARRVTRELLAVLGIPPDEAGRLRDLPVGALIDAQPGLTPRLVDDEPLHGVPFSPVVDGLTIPTVPLAAIRDGSARDKALLIGTMLDEARLFTWEDSAAADDPAIALLAAELFEEPTDRLVRAQLRHAPAVWRYSFRWRTPVAGGSLGACHSLDLPFVFDCLDIPGLDTFVGDAPPQSLADLVSASWANFARTGDPGGMWPRFTEEGEETMILDAGAEPDEVSAGSTRQGRSAAAGGPPNGGGGPVAGSAVMNSAGSAVVNSAGSAVMNSAGMRVTGVVNLRDVGGFRTADGRMVATGQIYRSGALRPTEEDRERLAELHLTAVYDLRTTSEAAAEPDEVPDGATYRLLNVYGNEHLVDVPRNPADGREIMLTIYRRFATGDVERSTLGELFRSLARTDGPQLFHCASGKDRTGWVAAALLLALGVPLHDVAADFVRSNEFIARSEAFRTAMDDLSAEQIEAFKPFAIVSADYLHAVLSELDAAFGGIDGYFRDGLDVSDAEMEMLRSRLLSGGG